MGIFFYYKRKRGDAPNNVNNNDNNIIGLPRFNIPQKTSGSFPVTENNMSVEVPMTFLFIKK